MTRTLDQAVVLQDGRHAEVYECHVVRVVEEDVGGFQVAVDDGPVQALEDLRDLDGHTQLLPVVQLHLVQVALELSRDQVEVQLLLALLQHVPLVPQDPLHLLLLNLCRGAHYVHCHSPRDQRQDLHCHPRSALHSAREHHSLRASPQHPRSVDLQVIQIQQRDVQVFQLEEVVIIVFIIRLAALPLPLLLLLILDYPLPQRLIELDLAALLLSTFLDLPSEVLALSHVDHREGCPLDGSPLLNLLDLLHEILPTVLQLRRLRVNCCCRMA